MGGDRLPGQEKAQCCAPDRRQVEEEERPDHLRMDKAYGVKGEGAARQDSRDKQRKAAPRQHSALAPADEGKRRRNRDDEDRKSTRLNSSHANISYAVFCLK